MNRKIENIKDEKGTKVLVLHIVGERFHDVAEFYESHERGNIYIMKEDATLMVESGTWHDDKHLLVKHVRDAVSGHEVYQGHIVIDRHLRRSCEQHSLIPVNVPGGQFPLLNDPKQVVIADFSRNGANFFIIKDEKLKDDVFDFAYRVKTLENKKFLRKYGLDKVTADFWVEVKRVCEDQEIVKPDWLFNYIYHTQERRGGTVLNKKTKVEDMPFIIEDIAFSIVDLSEGIDIYSDLKNKIFYKMVSPIEF